MRIVKELKIEDISISIFKMEHKFTLKIEWNRMEQVFKLDGREGIENLDQVLAIIDKNFVQNVKASFTKMSENRNDRLKALQDIENEEFPEII